jgi:hypothetical protein
VAPALAKTNGLFLIGVCIVLDETIRYMQETVHSRPKDLVFNLVEVGISEWEDRKPKKVVIPVKFAGQTIHH